MNQTSMLVHNILTSALSHAGKYQHWTLQGFGMLRLYLSRELRLHVWNSKFTVHGVTTIHDHPWHLESDVVSGKITNTRYLTFPCIHTDDQVAALRLRMPFIKSQIICGTGGGNDKASLKARGERMWIKAIEPEVYTSGMSYKQRADEVHHTSYDDGTVTLVTREFLPDTEHAHVFFRANEEWVSAEPRSAEPWEIQEILSLALERWNAS